MAGSGDAANHQDLLLVTLVCFFDIFDVQELKKEVWFILIGAALTILLCDQITSTFMKPFFARLRPSQDPTMLGLLHHVDGYKGGRYGFSSGHAANTLGVALFVWLTLKSVYKWIGFIFIWALLMTYTRIYLGVHFPGDILVGGTIGLICGFIGFKASQYLRHRYHKKTSTVNPVIVITMRRAHLYGTCSGWSRCSPRHFMELVRPAA